MLDKDKIADKLREIVESKGRSFTLDASKLKEQLRIDFQGQESSFDILIKISASRLAWEIMKLDVQVVSQVKYKELLDKVKKICGVTDESYARWGLDSWIEALGKQIEGRSRKIISKQPMKVEPKGATSSNVTLDFSEIYSQVEVDLKGLIQREKEYKDDLSRFEDEKGIITESYNEESQQINDYTNEIEKYSKSIRDFAEHWGWVSTSGMKSKVKSSGVAGKRTSIVNPRNQAMDYFKLLKEKGDKVLSWSRGTMRRRDSGGYNGCFTLIGISFFLSIIIAVIARLFGAFFIGAFFIALQWLLIIFAAIYNWVPFYRWNKNDYSDFEEYLSLCERMLQEWSNKAKKEYSENINILEKKYNNMFLNLQKHADIKQLSIAEKMRKITTGLPVSTDAWNSIGAPRISIRSVTAIPPFFRVGEVWSNILGQTVTCPVLIRFNEKCNLVFEINQYFDKNTVVSNVKSNILRLLASFPPAKINFVFIDPLGLGNNFSEFMSLNDYDESLVGTRVWTEYQDIDKILKEMTSHMEEVIQKHLRNQYKTITEYNEDNKELAEPYRVLVIFDFPSKFSDESIKRLISITENGPRCGVYTIIVRNTEAKVPYGFDTSDLYKNSRVIRYKDWLRIDDDNFGEYYFSPDEFPPTLVLDKVIKTVGEAVQSTPKIDVTYKTLIGHAKITNNSYWTYSTKNLLEIPIGITAVGKRKIQSLMLGGPGNNHYALLVGQTGSGKSNLLHVIITTGALMYPPDELELYIIDFKEGVEFKPYADIRLPHCKVIAIESEREFGISILRRLMEEQHKRSELFKDAGVRDIESYREKTNIKLPRVLLIVDEFQMFFAGNDQIAVESKSILDHLARQGRNCGMHYILSTQSLMGVASDISRSTLAQIETRIALKCTDSDSRLILSDDNSEARLLLKPGEAIYNDRGGLKEGNNRMQIALFGDNDRKEYSTQLRKLVNSKGIRQVPIIFEGNAPAKFEACPEFAEAIKKGCWLGNVKSVNSYIGESISIKPTVSFCFKRQNSNNALIVTKEEKEAVAMTATSVLSISAQLKQKDVEFHVVDLTKIDETWADVPEMLREFLPHRVEIYGKRDLRSLMVGFRTLLDNRMNSDNSNFNEVFLILLEPQRAIELRDEQQDFSFTSIPNKEGTLNDTLKLLINEGPELGIHVIACFDSYSSFEKVFSRGNLQFFSMRVIGVMNSEDSERLIDSSEGSKIDKANRLIYYDDDRPGLLEKFRPFDLPTKAYISLIGQVLRKFK